MLINDYCFSTGYDLYFPCQVTNKQALMEKSTSPPYISMSRDREISYYQTYQVLQDSIIRVPLIIPKKYDEDKEIRFTIVANKIRQIRKMWKFKPIKNQKKR